MERLTFRSEYGVPCYLWEFNGCNGCYDIENEDLLINQIDRLAAYEDTGLTPEEVEALKAEVQSLKAEVDRIHRESFWLI